MRTFDPRAIYSVGAVAEGEWEKLVDVIPASVSLEINMGCPNLNIRPRISDSHIRELVTKHPLVIFKLTYSQTVFSEIESLIESGARYLHLFNTIPSPRGGVSGKQVQEVALKTIRQVKDKYPDVIIVGGGGMYSIEDVTRYREAGASHFSLGSVFLSPIKAAKLLKHI